MGKSAIGVLVLLALAGFAVSAFARTTDEHTSEENNGDLPMPTGDPDANVNAFLALIRKAESRGDYSALVGGGQLSDYSDHPANLGWPGIIMPDGRKTTAAGAYQITKTTWNTFVQPRLSLPDFSPASQDQAAVMILQEKRPGSLDAIREGRFTDAIYKLRGEWEAFDRMINGTYHMTLADAHAYYQDQGGTSNV